VKRCPHCGATSETDDRFCEADGTQLVEAPAAAAGPSCPYCSEGKLEADGYCSSCGRRPASSRPTPALVQAGSPLAGGTVVSSLAFDMHLVSAPGGATVLVVLGDAPVIERQADALDRIGGRGVFPRVVECGVDDTHGSYISLALPPSEARPLAEVGATLGMAGALRVVRGMLDAAQTVERLGLAWEPQGGDVFVMPDGSVRVARLRVPRRLLKGEGLDARVVIEGVGSAFVPSPAKDGPPRAFRMFLPHVAVPGEAGNSIADLRGEAAAIEAELGLPKPDGSRLAGVCDPGLRRAHNEDAMAFARGVTQGEPWAVLVLCDGVSSSSHADQASTVAAKTACDALAHFARSGDVAFEAGAAAVATAIRAAHVAVCAQGIEAGPDDPPGTTIVAGLVWRRRLTVGWVGDSRAYWIADNGSELLTTDHSWANEAIARGEVTAEEAMRSPLAHALTRCLGPLEVVDPIDLAGGRRRIQEVDPEVRARDLPGPGWVLLCSDGFWNYFSAAGDVATLVRSAGDRPPPEKVARGLVNEALVRGGHDNTTVLVYEHR
jgi:serine/threonine protein phosphatase PrpC